MKHIWLIAVTALLFSCGKTENDLIVKGNIKGLKKGTVYLKKVQDTILITVDSLVLNGTSNFELQASLKSPEMFILDLDKKSTEQDRIQFFADKGVTEINTTLKNFVFDAKIKGSKQQEIYEEYRAMLSKLKNKRLELIKEQFEAQRRGDSIANDSLIKLSNSLLKRQYLYTVNFALNHKDSEVAPYLALSEIYNAQVKYLDTINQSLTPEIKNSLYGKELDAFIKEIKEKE
ncbi:DUF4369 domain-containing protein [Neotamlana laminarinivorans]|uniref:DUF4369 domain-containing protein n=1 Tax=Neotamlana laminarinivorans TaxID=2883124 RepID=A0A9X1I2T9_9FLAO|nr:DUF4369 domain-containing protein [Tamlana laminarinivorans]MCB4799608.1 DUF4369 domain-containing protein [Tamlana laminarinivorans]